MKLLVERKWKKETYTIGRLYLNGELVGRRKSFEGVLTESRATLMNLMRELMKAEEQKEPIVITIRDSLWVGALKC